MSMTVFVQQEVIAGCFALFVFHVPSDEYVALLHVPEGVVCSF